MANWTNEQLDAINKEGTNIIVSAGAGSGKTAVLTERVLRKLKSGISINKLLILTFTKAAANEMKERIRKNIKKNPDLPIIICQSLAEAIHLKHLRRQRLFTSRCLINRWI